MSKELRDKLSEIHKGMKIHTKERKEYLSNKWSGEGNPNSKKIVGPDGTVYSSIKECSDKTGIYYGTLSKWIKNKPEKGYKVYKG